MNKEKIRGKNICPFFAFICPITILYTVAYIVSNDKDQLFGVSLSLLLAKVKYPIINVTDIVKKSAMFVKEIDIFPNASMFKLSKFLMVNWSKGLLFHVGRIYFV